MGLFCTDETAADSLLKLGGRDIYLHYKEKMSAFFWRGDMILVEGVVQVNNFI